MGDSGNRQEVIDINRKLLEAIAAGDWDTYQDLCDPALTCFEPEARGHLVAGLAFHKFYFDLSGDAELRNTTMVLPQVHLLGDVAIVAYVRLVQSLDNSGAPQTSRCEETRVWQRRDGRWRHIHFHRSV